MSDQFTTLVNALAALLPSTGLLNADGISIGDDTVLNSGNPLGAYALIWPGEFTDRPDGQNRRLATWTIDLDLLVRAKDKSAVTTFMTVRGAVVDLLRQYPQLNQATVEITDDIEITGGESLTVFDKAGTGPLFYGQTLTLSIETIEDVTYLG